MPWRRLSTLEQEIAMLEAGIARQRRMIAQIEAASIESIASRALLARMERRLAETRAMAATASRKRM
jgi:hypothetical protein